jgi:hypothetical protein
MSLPFFFEKWKKIYNQDKAVKMKEQGPHSFRL